MEFISHLTNSRPRTGFDKSSLARLEQVFRTTVGNEQEIRREEFQKIVTSKNVSCRNELETAILCSNLLLGIASFCSKPFLLLNN